MQKLSSQTLASAVFLRLKNVNSVVVLVLVIILLISGGTSAGIG